MQFIPLVALLVGGVVGFVRARRKALLHQQTVAQGMPQGLPEHIKEFIS